MIVNIAATAQLKEFLASPIATDRRLCHTFQYKRSSKRIFTWADTYGRNAIDLQQPLMCALKAEALPKQQLLETRERFSGALRPLCTLNAREKGWRRHRLPLQRPF